MAEPQTPRKITRKVFVGDVPVGGGAPIPVQTMTKCKTHEVDAVVDEILAAEEEGCQIVRCTVPDEEDARAIGKIRSRVHIPVVADVHFNYRMALIAAEEGADKIRINPGNIGNPQKVKMVLDACKERRIPIRIGVNAGSLEKELLKKYGYPTAEAMVESARRHIQICEENEFNQLIVSLKASDVPLMMSAYRLFSQNFDYPIHLGVTEAGTPWHGSIKSALGIGALLAEGIGDTIRISLAGPGTEEVRVGREILKTLGLVSQGVTLVACPTCGRLEVDMFPIVEKIEERVRKIKAPIKVAVMGCIVNGPGEASGADLGVALGNGAGVLYKNGKVAARLTGTEILPRLLEEIDRMEAEWQEGLAVSGTARC